MLAEKGFKLVATCCSGANGLTPIGLTMCSNQNTINQQVSFKIKNLISKQHLIFLKKKLPLKKNA